MGIRLRGTFGAGYPIPSSRSVSVRMVANRSTNTRPEIALRSALHRAGLRFRIHHKVRIDIGRPIVIDIAFPRRRLAVFLDGCFWHACREHRSIPNANAAYWRPKLARNIERDRQTADRLERGGWTVIRIWEHEDVASAQNRVQLLWQASD